MSPGSALVAIRLLHTVIWVFFVGCIVGAPLAAAQGRFGLSGLLVGCVALEGVVLLLNRWACPLTAIAARHTERREENFDIYLPRWLARYNKAIFTPLYLLGAAYALYEWWRQV